jgi:hypothetical protein
VIGMVHPSAYGKHIAGVSFLVTSADKGGGGLFCN